MRVFSELSVDEVEEQLRRQASNKGDPSLFYHYIDGAVWKFIEIDENDFRRLRLIEACMWDKLSNNTREPIAVAERLKAGNLAGDEVETMEEVLRMSKDSGRLKQPIFVRELDNGEWLVFDGCTRCVSRALTHLQSGRAIEPIQAYFGTRL